MCVQGPGEHARVWQEGRGDRLAESGVGRGGLEVQLEGRPGGPVLGGVGWQGSRPGAQIGEPGLGGGLWGRDAAVSGVRVARRWPRGTPRMGMRGQVPWSSGSRFAEAQERTFSAQRQVYLCGLTPSRLIRNGFNVEKKKALAP